MPQRTRAPRVSYSRGYTEKLTDFLHAEAKAANLGTAYDQIRQKPLSTARKHIFECGLKPKFVWLVLVCKQWCGGGKMSNMGARVSAIHHLQGENGGSHHILNNIKS